ncbi:hypothetical protein RhiirC2_861942 [Rhizophagus irregularis]|uniref:Uncharacterized protein n=1 Tax=Rhizophagus irregularis TaxID=588596 RepID=A0A2N1NU30_9GLOM|nr:hypothetical protein RhiirC2_861942 [Rhizophagus irregularis]
MDGTPARLGLNPVETEVYNNMIARERITFNALPDDNARIGYVRALVDRDRTWRERSTLYRKKTFSRHSDQADALGIISNPPIPDPRKTSQSSGISPLSNLMGTFALSSPPIRMGGIEGTATQQVKSTLSIPFTS